MINHKIHGFTLIEIIIALAIVFITAAIALSAYKNYLLSSQRSDATNALLAISLAEERYRSSNLLYGTLTQVWPVTTSPSGYYTLSASNITATTYTLTATAVGQQANDSQNGTSCSTMTLALSSGTFTKTPAACWPS